MMSKFFRAGSSKQKITSFIVRNQTSSAVDVQGVEHEYANAKPFSEIPTPKGTIPFIGDLSLLNQENQKNALNYHQNFYNELGPLYVLKVFGFEMLVVHDPDMKRNVLVKDGKMPYVPTFEKIGFLRKKYIPEFKSIGLAAQEEEWLEVRQLVQQDMMRPSSAMFYIDDLSDLTDDLIAKIETTKDPNGELEITPILFEYAMEAINIMFLGSKMGVLQGSDFGIQMIEKISKFFQLFPAVIITPNALASISPQVKEFVKISSELFKLSAFQIDKAIEKDHKDGSLKGSILGKMIERCGEGSQIPTVMAADAMAAGIDTTGTTSSLLLYHLATNPDVQEKLFQEIVEIVGSNGKMDESKLKSMRFLKACQRESMRMMPIVMGTARTNNQDIVIGGYQIPKGKFILLLGFVTAMEEKAFANAHNFIPERWMRGCPEHNKDANPYNNIPFGHGPRACIGQRFAKLELYMVLFKIIQKYKISYEGAPINL